MKRLLPSRLYHLVDVLTRYRTAPLDELAKRYEVKRVKSGPLLQAAMRLHATVYLERGFIDEHEVKDGVMTVAADPYPRHAEYFVAVDSTSGEVVALIRQIHQRAGMALPVFRHGLVRKSYAYVHKNDIVELSAFAKKRGVDSRVILLLFGELFRYSEKRGHQYWIFACDKQVYARMKTLFGRLLKRVGPTTYYMGSDVVPAEIDLDRAITRLARSYRRSVPPLRSIRKFLYRSFSPLSGQAKTTLRRAVQLFFWDSYAKSYDGLLRFHPYVHLVDHVSDLVLQSRPRRVLDLGCGTGNVSVQLLERDHTVQIDAIDWSRTMLKKLTHKTNDPRLVVRQYDALRFLAATRRSYDVIVLNNVVYTIADRAKLWRLIDKRLAPGGRVVIAHPDTASSQVLVAEHVRERSVWSLLRPKLVLVGLFDTIISLLGGVSSKYEFTPQQQLLDEIELCGLQLEGEVGRCYGGHTRGIDLLFTVRKS